MAYPVCVHIRTFFSMCHFDRPQSDTKGDDIVELRNVVVSLGLCR